MMTRNAWLKCSVTEGLFPGEYAIQTSTVDGTVFSLFASEPAVDPGHGLIRVNVLEVTPKAWLVYLPESPLDFPGRTVNVSPQEIVE
jgi:hypothetical protein